MSAKRILIAIVIIVIIITILLSVRSCTSVAGEAVRFRVTVEDQSGHKLGSGVWEYKKWPGILSYYQSSFLGQAFPILMPDGDGNAFVIMRRIPRIDVNPQNVLRTAFETGLKKGEVSEMWPKQSHLHDQAKRLRNLRRFRGRAEIVEDKLLVVTFADVNDPETVKRLIESLYAKLRFFVEITSDPISTGIEKHLPWIVELENKKISGLDGESGRSGNDQTPLPQVLLIYDFKTRASHPLF